MRTLTADQTAALQAMPEKFLTPEETVYLLSIGVRTLWRLAAKGQLPAPARFSRKLVRFNRRDLFLFMQRHTSPAPLPKIAEAPTPPAKEAGPVFLIRDFRTGEEEFYRPNCGRPVFIEAT
jgi:predicted DNA-binding transcriptional regulator AlpA